jgi:hypothetical protein
MYNFGLFLIFVALPSFPSCLLKTFLPEFPDLAFILKSSRLIFSLISFSLPFQESTFNFLLTTFCCLFLLLFPLATFSK